MTGPMLQLLPGDGVSRRGAILRLSPIKEIGEGYVQPEEMEQRLEVTKVFSFGVEAQDPSGIAHVLAWQQIYRYDKRHTT